MVVVRPRAAADIQAAQAWYEEQSSGLGQAFVTSVQAAVERVRRAPLLNAVVDGDVRRALVRRFPYAVFYLLDGDDIVVIAVFHASRDPRDWKARA